MIYTASVRSAHRFCSQSYTICQDAELGEPLVRLTIEAVRCYLVRPWIFNHAGVFMWKIISIDDSKDPDGSA